VVLVDVPPPVTLLLVTPLVPPTPSPLVDATPFGLLTVVAAPPFEPPPVVEPWLELEVAREPLVPLVAEVLSGPLHPPVIDPNRQAMRAAPFLSNMVRSFKHGPSRQGGGASPKPPASIDAHSADF
jgi:hypothetical protein